jgi:transcriptional regulator GlxA family with amidase domain
MSKTEQKVPARAVVIFAYDGAQLIDIAGPTQTLTTANEEGASPPYAIRLAAVSGGPIRTASGVKLIADPLPRAVTIDTLLVPGGPGIHMFRKDRRALAALQRLCMRSRRICAVCTGAFALAEIGLLNKCRVVTHWRSCAQLAEEFPEVCVDPEPLFIQVGKIWTTAGVTAGIDLSLALIEQDHSAALATSVARRLVVYMKRPGGQRQYSEPLELQRATSAPYRQSYAEGCKPASCRLAHRDACSECRPNDTHLSPQICRSHRCHSGRSGPEGAMRACSVPAANYATEARADCG